MWSPYPRLTLSPERRRDGPGGARWQVYRPIVVHRLAIFSAYWDSQHTIRVATTGREHMTYLAA